MKFSNRFKMERSSLNSDINSHTMEHAEPKSEKGLQSFIAVQEKEININELDKNPWIIIGTSVQGNGHKHAGIPCQDSNLAELLNDRWGIAIVSDGAGSARNSHLGSKFLVHEAKKMFHKLLLEKGWIEKPELPKEEEWDSESRKVIFNLRKSLSNYGEELVIPLHELSATLIIMIFSTSGVLMIHIGDGRAGYQGADDYWKSALDPFQGEQVGETAFITLDLDKYPDLVETRVIRENIKSIVLMSDGCEKVSWETVQINPESGSAISVNKPYKPFFEASIIGFQQLIEQEEQASAHEKWTNYLDYGHPGFQKESDDKTMVIGFLKREIDYTINS
jgi:hypothetical protein